MTPYDAFRQLLQRYARAADDRDVDALAGLFHPDARIEGARGAQTRAEWLDTMRGPRAFPASMHVVGEPLVTYRDGASEASLDTYAVVHQIGDRAAGQGDLTLGIRYLDEVVVHEGHWVIHRRAAKTLWMR